MPSKLFELSEYPFRLVKEGRRLRYFIEIVNYLGMSDPSRVKRNDVLKHLVMIGRKDSKLMTNFAITGTIKSEETAKGYISNAKAIYLIENGKELKLTEFGRALQVISNKRKRDEKDILSYFKLNEAEKVFFLFLLFLIEVKYATSWLSPLLSYLSITEGKSFNEISRAYFQHFRKRRKIRPYRGESLKHRLRPLLEWFIDLDISEKQNSQFYLTNKGESFLYEIKRERPTDFPIFLSKIFLCHQSPTEDELKKEITSFIQRLHIQTQPFKFIEIPTLILGVISESISKGWKISLNDIKNEIFTLTQEKKAFLSGTREPSEPIKILTLTDKHYYYLVLKQ